MPKLVKKAPPPRGPIGKPRVIYLRFRVENLCKCGGVLEFQFLESEPGVGDGGVCCTNCPFDENMTMEEVHKRYGELAVWN